MAYEIEPVVDLLDHLRQDAFSIEIQNCHIEEVNISSNEWCKYLVANCHYMLVTVIEELHLIT